MKDLKYLKLLSEQFPNIPEVSTEIINLKAILNLPKSTEHFLTDLHGEAEAFKYMLKTASGVIEYKIDQIFGNRLKDTEKRELATLIFYPKTKMKELNERGGIPPEWYKEALDYMVRITQEVSSIYTRSKVRKALPEKFSYIIEELLHIKECDPNKEAYKNKILTTIIEIGRAKDFIVALSELIQSFAVDKLHIIGDIYDRGPSPDVIMNVLKSHHNVDIQWGNHDILWMGAALGQKSLVATALRIALRYGNLEFLEERYGVNMRPLSRFAMNYYPEPDPELFEPQLINKELDKNEIKIMAQMQKAIAVIQFKLEGQLIKKHPEFKMNEALYLEKIDYDNSILELDGKKYQLTDTNFPTIKSEDPYSLSTWEEEVIDQLSYSFKNNDKLQEDIKFLFNNGSMYKKYNGNLLFHGCVPLTEDGDFSTIEVNGGKYQGKKLMDFFDDIVRRSYSNKEEEADFKDWLWYLWRGELSPLFGKDRMTTFLRYFTDEDEPELYKENKNPYYQARENEFICKKILSEFGLDTEKGHIINGHTPVAEKMGESPIKGNGRLLVIDGGIAAAYHEKTGIAGYTLTYSNTKMRLMSHEPFISKQDALHKDSRDTISAVEVLKFDRPQKIADTDIGEKLSEDVKYLMQLLEAYKDGIIKEKYN
ncbi:fructose-1,6-bisphosphatase [Halanaerobium congolense]|jgi:fructose-1,6-bisphosphatase-3|uniref:Fructose-1,6-bisphosphatase class 3 n=1 Tax=Halanaerobium congolense TaxID=54121 RepID=A0A1G6N0T5_9FIRM|nr:fructose-1,6-bisphosphatase [Halanaerobium congolense]KXS50231.1 MAG: fructose-1,6-bisphosphatase III [Halanaerobium sp. T82-1]OEG63432.1 MAG: fructose 1,6-bisphosphatase [Halanaerobium sp. MDAL1]PUU89505.1 MAG: fructose-1,6-bisphosphatase III [Halanaerobium sp.]PXV67618.1 fructose-1,6-bisphosphatase-3 [Halanaerobium congolense]TDP26688.1 fructose-1,6-bisphosphatase-3 [Halanaerobium congolense]